MTIHVSQDVENSINAAVQSGRFLSVDDAMDKAARLLLRQLEIEQQQTRHAAGGIDVTPDPLLGLWQDYADEMDAIVADAISRRKEEQRADQEAQQRLYAAGSLSEIKPSRRVSTGTDEFTPIVIEGEPLSETIIRERR